MQLAQGTITGNGESAPFLHRGGDLQIALGNTLGGGTVTLWSASNGGSGAVINPSAKFFPIVDSAKTVPDQYIADITQECWVKLVVSGGTNPVVDWAASI